MQRSFSGNLFFFYGFDVGDDIDLVQIAKKQLIKRKSIPAAKYFKNYHLPYAIEVPEEGFSDGCDNAQLHSFGVISLRYKHPFEMTLDELRSHISTIEGQYHEQSVYDAQMTFEKIKDAIFQPQFFQLRRSYVLVQVNPHVEMKDPLLLKESYGSNIAEILRFETETLSEFQKNEIMELAIGYYRGDLIIIDTDAAFMYDDEYEDVLDLFAFANIQQLELQYFDRVLDQRLNTVYERGTKNLPLAVYMPLWGTLYDPVGDLGKLRVDISVIIERIENSIKLADEPYYLEIYNLLTEKLDLKRWAASIDKKLDIIRDVGSVYQNKADVVRQDFFSLLIIILIFMEFVVGILHYFK